MKTEQRHELHRNELIHLIQVYGPRIRSSATIILGVAILLALVWLSFSILRNTRQSAAAAAWREVEVAIRAGDAEGLRTIAADYRRTPAAARALQAAGVLTLQESVQTILADRAEAMESLKRAQQDLESALRMAKDDPVLRVHSLLALAQVFETMGDLEKAKEQYQRVLDSAEYRTFHETAKQRLEFLNLEDTREFVEWFAQQKTEPPAANASGRPSSPSIYDDLPKSDLLLPDRDELQRSELERQFGPMLPPEKGTPSEADADDSATSDAATSDSATSDSATNDATTPDSAMSESATNGSATDETLQNAGPVDTDAQAEDVTATQTEPDETSNSDREADPSSIDKDQHDD